MTVQELAERRKVLLDEANALNKAATAESRDLTEDEAARIDAILDETAGLQVDIDKATATLDRKNRLAGATDRLRETLPRITSPDMPGTGFDGRGVYEPDEPWLVHGGNLKAYENTPVGRKLAHRNGMFLAATVHNLPWAQNWCRNNGVQMDAIMTEGTNSAGGYLVPDEMSNRIIYLRDRFGVARRECFVEPMSSDTKSVPRQTGNVTFYAVNEGGSITASQQAYDRVNLVARKWAALLRYSSELDEDSIVQLADRVTLDMAIGAAEKEDDALFNGDGTSTYHGILGIRSKLIDVDGAGTDSAGLITATAADDQWPKYIASDFALVMGVLPEYAYQGGNAKWYCSRQGWAGTLARLAQASGGTTMEETIGGPSKISYMGFPVVLSPKMPSATTAYDNLVVFIFGDMRMGTTLGSRRGFRFAVLRELYAATDEIGIVATVRFDINANDVGDATNAGPLVGLAGNTN